jgi:hypothetical protein
MALVFGERRPGDDRSIRNQRPERKSPPRRKRAISIERAASLDLQSFLTARRDARRET